MEMRASRMATPVSSTTTMIGGEVDWAAAAQIRTRVIRGARMRSFVDILTFGCADVEVGFLAVVVENGLRGRGEKSLDRRGR